MSELEMEKPDYMTTIKLHSSIRKRLAKHATKEQTYEALIIELLDKIEGDWLNSVTHSNVCFYCKMSIKEHTAKDLVNCSLGIIDEVIK